MGMKWKQSHIAWALNPQQNRKLLQLEDDWNNDIIMKQRRIIEGGYQIMTPFCSQYYRIESNLIMNLRFVFHLKELKMGPVLLQN